MPKFPFTNYHELNLDWILKKVTALFDASEENAATIRTYNARLTNAEQTATNAETAATAAQQLADAASENADSALSVAGTADSKADSALTAATNAAGAVAGALTTAQEAQQTAAAAVATANDAAATASSLESLANTANQNATAALETAQTADQKAVAAQSAAATADQKAVAAQTAATANAGNISTLQTNVSNLNRQISELETVDENIENAIGVYDAFDVSKITTGKAINYTNGLENNVSVAFISDYIPIVPNSKIYITQQLGSSTYGNFFFDENKKIVGKYYSNASYTNLTAPSNAFYIRVNGITARKEEMHVYVNDYTTYFNTFKQNVIDGYFNEFYYAANHWSQQGIQADGAILNITNAASLFKSVPNEFSNPFCFVSKVEQGQSFTVVRYTKSNDVYTWADGINITEKGNFYFPEGYYKFGFRDNSANTQDYYNMTQADRDSAVYALCEIYLNSVAGNRFIELENQFSDKKFKKPFVICSFDWYSDSWQKYQIMKETYGLNATFCLDYQTTNYDLTAGLTREQFNTMLENGWDFALYGCGSSAQPSEQSYDGWKAGIAALIAQKENIGIYKPVMYNTPQNNASAYITNACKDLGFLLQRANNPNSANYFVSPDQYNTGCRYLTNDSLSSCKDAVETAIANNYGVVFYAHNMSETTDLSAATFTDFCSFLANKVTNNEIEVLSAREYAYKYLRDKANQNDYEADIKRFNYLHSLIT